MKLFLSLLAVTAVITSATPVTAAHKRPVTAPRVPSPPPAERAMGKHHHRPPYRDLSERGTDNSSVTTATGKHHHRPPYRDLSERGTDKAYIPMPTEPPQESQAAGTRKHP